MTILTLLPDDDEVLLTKTKEVSFPLSDEDKQLIRDMYQTLAYRNAVGLAANQVGADKQIFIMHVNGMKFTCINPEITGIAKSSNLMREGCLSFPSLVLQISRPAAVIVSYYEIDGSKVETTLDGLAARVFQHEFDHLQGEVFTNKVSKLKLALAKKKLSRVKFLK